jgi:hypothetical protein
MIRPKEPYKPWNVKDSDFPKQGPIEKQAKFLLNYAILAPSTFNTQPWLFLIDKNVITVYPDKSRRLRTSDPHNRLLYVSLGCAVKNLEVAANAFGLSTTKKYLNKNNTALVEVTLRKSILNRNRKTLLNSIKNRLTNRNKYLPKKVPTTIVHKLTETAKNNELNLVVTQDKGAKEKIIKLAEKGDHIVWDNPEFKEEHLKWIRHNLTLEHDGMPAFTVGIPLLPSLFAKLVIRKPNFAKIQARKNRHLLNSTPYFSFILSNKHNQETWIKVGETFEEISLAATKEGLAVALLAQIVEVGNLYRETMKILNLNLRPQLFFRLGYPSKPADHSPRRKIEAVLLSK